jgi:hypothetical protein
MNNHICQNCDHQFKGAYCNHCGQKTTHRITMGHIAHDLAHAFTHADKGFFYMMLQLFKNPGKVAREYILEGKRKRYFTPFQYILLIGAAATIVVVNSHYMENAMRAMNMAGDTVSTRQAAMMKQISYLQGKYYNILILIQLPFLSLSTFWLYRKYRYNYAEHLTLHTFITAQTALVGMVLMIGLFFIGHSDMSMIRLFTTLMGIIGATYHIVMYMQFFRQKTFAGFLKALLAYILGVVIFFIAMMIVGTIVGLVMLMKSKMG